jgi:hypothetical protein
MSTSAGFVGRQSELRILGERLAAAGMGHPQVVYVEGEAGGGKSTLLSRFLGSLPNAVILQVGGDEAEMLLSYGIVDQLQPETVTEPGTIRWPSELGCWICLTACKSMVVSSCSPSTICSGPTGRRHVRSCSLCGGCVPTRCWPWCRRGPVSGSIPAGRGSRAEIPASPVSAWAGLVRATSPSWRAQTPLVVLLIDLLAPAGWRLPEERLVDTLLGCAIVLLVGYAPWPGSWHSHLPRQFAATLRDVCRFMQAALIPDPDPAARGRGWQLRRKAYRALGDLHGEYQRAMSEPAAMSRRASAWWPAIVALDEVADAATATGVAIRRGAPARHPTRSIS